jgi:prepilin-type N-terminal cleavage/methylation domain-containing protein
MRTFIKNYIDAKTRQKLEETGEEGFSLIELIVVIVILGILLAIAIPVFLGLQQQANQAALDTITANAASQAAARFAQGDTAAEAQLTFTNFTSEPNAPAGLALTVTATANQEIDTFCVTGKATGLTDATSGPGCGATP